ncbi:hypothetical protein [Oligoflexus tunisiensis]|uniref:hypothetical protein n=1 Tax=Oligoflexus tunisiensis TaxID=708132 RepID=UPI00114C9534|nr:hypothetical protein [Oligoflexus tunisiensis]
MFFRISVAFVLMIAAAYFVVPRIWKKEHPAAQKLTEDAIPSEADIEAFSLAELQEADERLNRYYAQHGLLKKLGDGNTEELHQLLAAKSHVQQRIEELKKNN